jgi:hypothetical protein
MVQLCVINLWLLLIDKVFKQKYFIPVSIYRIAALIIAVLSTISILLIDGLYIKVLERGQ